MNCRSVQHLLSSERDGALASHERADLEGHLTDCADCRQARAAVAGAVDRWREFALRIRAPDAERAWQDISREIRTTPATKRPGILGLPSWALPLGAAAALAVAVAIVPGWNSSAPATLARADSARADFVEVPDDASPVVYVDGESGWLVVWSVDDVRPARM